MSWRRDILEYQSVKRWLLNVRGSSARVYTRAFSEFITMAKTDPDELLALFDKDKGQTVHDLAKQFHQSLERQTVSSKTCNLFYTAVRSFFTWNDRRLGRMPNKFAGHTQYESERILNE